MAKEDEPKPILQRWEKARQKHQDEIKEKFPEQRPSPAPGNTPIV